MNTHDFDLFKVSEMEGDPKKGSIGGIECL